MVVVCIGLYALTSHFALILPGGKALAAALAIAIPAGAAWALLFHGLRRIKAAAWLAAALASTIVALFLMATWQPILNNADNLYFAQHLGTNALLGWVFGHTLAAGKTPLVVQFARMVHRDLPPAIEAYAKQVTTAWVVFFAATCALSILLYFATPLAWWSTFGVLLQWPSVAAFFVAEYGFRRWRFRDFDHASMRAGFDAYRAHQAKKK
jgi:uncharacterized membrane protein